MYFVRPVTKHFSLFLHTDTLSREITNLFKPLLLVFQSGTILKLVCCNNNFLSYFQSFKMPPRWCILNSLFQLATAIFGSIWMSFLFAANRSFFISSVLSIPILSFVLFYYLSCPVLSTALFMFYHLSCSINCLVLLSV